MGGASLSVGGVLPSMGGAALLSVVGCHACVLEGGIGGGACCPWWFEPGGGRHLLV